MIKPEDLRIGDLIRVNRDCAFPKGTMCAVTDIRHEKVFKDKVGVVSLSAINGPIQETFLAEMEYCSQQRRQSAYCFRESSKYGNRRITKHKLYNT